MSNRILAIDQGTTGTTCLVVQFEKDGRVEVVGRGYAELPQHFPQPGRVEHDLGDIWQSVQKAGQEALRSADSQGKDLAAIGITNQRETTGVWDAQGRPVHRAIVWQDRRTADFCRGLQEAGHGPSIRKRTGLVIDPYFSGSKLGWILREASGLRARANAGELRFGTIDSWLVWQLTGGQVHVTDAANASRTQLYDIHKHRWDPGLCALLGDIPSKMLPEVRGNSEVYGKTHGCSFLPDGIPIAGMAGDQQAALFGQACLEPGMAKCTYGTGAFALVNTGAKAAESQRGLLTTVAWQLGTQCTYALEGSVFVAGAVVQWLRDGLGLFANSSEVEALANQVEDSGGVILVPALTGLGAPHWRPGARGLIAGITRGTTRAHIARAALEGVALQVYDLLDAMRLDSGAPLSILRVDGGAAANNLLMQFQADLLGIPTHRPHIVETTAMGAAFLAALGVGICADLPAVAKTWTQERSFSPSMSKDKVRGFVQHWRDAVSKA